MYAGRSDGIECYTGKHFYLRCISKRYSLSEFAAVVANIHREEWQEEKEAENRNE